MAYYNNGKKGERAFCKLVEAWGGAYLVHDTVNQYKDIDCVLKRDKRTVSVKDQYSADKFQSFMFEHTQIRTSDKATIKGNLLTCEADLYAVASPTKWFLFDAPKLKSFILNGDFIERSTAAWAEANNRKVKGSNCYDRTMSYVVTFNQLRASDAFLYECKRI